MVEGVHGAVYRRIGLSAGAVPGRTRGLTGWVYRSIEEVTGWVGHSTDQALASWEVMLDPAHSASPSTPQREVALAALNGVMGDRLAALDNPLACTMGLWIDGQRLELQHAMVLPDARPTVVLMLHGLCMNELQWSRPSADHGTLNHGDALAHALHATPVYLRYNSGLHISDNGRQLAALLDGLQKSWPLPLTKLVVLAHSMGGLVARSALEIAQQQALPWVQTLQQIVFLGTPHQGAPLERAGHWLHTLLGSTPYSAPFTALARLRSAGITDLRYGYVRDQDWQDGDRFGDGHDHRTPFPLPAAVECYALAATLAAHRGRLAERLLGDGLVPLRSALGQHEQKEFDLQFPANRQAVVYRTGHLALLSSQVVQAQLLKWLA
jgi:pimeloyl-ACP methyl ester carboxylesterase